MVRGQMREHPIIFNTEMIRAILGDRKIQTRRAMKVQPECQGALVRTEAGELWYMWPHEKPGFPTVEHYCRFPYGLPGDRLWVREIWGYGSEPVPFSTPRFIYKADGWSRVAGDFWRSPIYMPRKASRITLKIVGIHVKHLQDMSRDEAFYEGINPIDPYLIEPSLPPGMPAAFPDYQNKKNFFTADPLRSFKSLWDSINAKRGYPWESNPWVWVIDFNKI